MSTTVFSDWFNRQLKRRDWSQADFHRASNVARSTISTWSTGLRIPDPEACQAIADVFGRDVDDVLVIAGHRPAKEALKPDDPKRELIGMLERIRMSDDRVTGLRGTLRAYLEADMEGRK